MTGKGHFIAVTGRILAIAGLLALSWNAANAASDNKSAANLREHLKTVYRAPEDYIVDKFKEHDLVIIGEVHHVQQNIALLSRLIPRLYKEAGVRFLGYEFFAASCQQEIDTLVNAKEYDTALERHIIRKSAIAVGLPWPYAEYVDVFRVVWELNRDIPEQSKRFRIVFMHIDMNWRDMHYGNAAQRKAAMLTLMEGDKHYAEQIIKEYERTGHKGLIWCGSTHAVTRLRGNPRRAPELRMGGVLYKRYGSRVFQVMLHAPWLYHRGRSVSFDYALNGVFDKILNDIARPIGFDVAGSPFADMRLPEEFMWTRDNPGATFGDYCDGYVWLVPLAEFRGNRLMSIAEIVPDEQTFRKIIHNAHSKAIQTLKSREEFIGLWKDAEDKFGDYQQTFMPFLKSETADTH